MIIYAIWSCQYSPVSIGLSSKHPTESIYSATLLCLGHQAAGLICKLLDRKKHGNLYSVHLHLASYTTRLSSCLSTLDNQAEDCCLVVPPTF